MTLRPSIDSVRMQQAWQEAKRGTCNRKQVGAILTMDGRIISTGYVGAPSGMPHCVDVGCTVGPDGGCTATLHAEANAIAYAARNGVKTDGGTLYTTLSPCVPCAKILISAGIRRVVYGESYRDQSGIDYLKQAGVEVLNITDLPI